MDIFLYKNALHTFFANIFLDITQWKRAFISLYYIAHFNFDQKSYVSCDPHDFAIVCETVSVWIGITMRCFGFVNIFTLNYNVQKEFNVIYIVFWGTEALFLMVYTLLRNKSGILTWKGVFQEGMQFKGIYNILINWVYIGYCYQL